MIRNPRLKSFLTNTVFKAVSLLNQVIPKDDRLVLLYSDMGFRDNILYIYDYMISEGYNRRYKIVRSQNDKPMDRIPENVTIESNVQGVITYLRAGHVFYCFGKLPIYPSKDQRVVQMWHGSPFKGADIRQKSEMTEDYRKSYYTHVLSTSELFNGFWSAEFDCGIQRVMICGQPRTDVMITPYSKDELDIFEKKLILWMPTFRKSKILDYSDVDNAKDFLPVVNVEDLDKLNACLYEHDIKLMIKLHPMQDTDGMAETDYSNLVIYKHEDFQKTGYDLYRLLGNADAIITDYSSVFLDYILLDRPIGFTEDDIDDYKNKRGFAMSDPDHYRAGPKIRTINDMMRFIEDVSFGIDEWKKVRGQVNREVNTYRDYQNRKRALEIGGVVKEGEMGK